MRSVIRAKRTTNVKTRTMMCERSLGLVAETEPWFEWLAAQRRSPITIKDYRHVVRTFAQFLVGLSEIVSLCSVQQHHLEAWLRGLNKRRLSPVTIGCYLHPILGLFSWLEARGEVFLNPGSNLLLPRIPRRLLPVIGEAEMLRLVCSVNGDLPVDLRDRAILEMAYATGLRCRELVGLHLGSIDLEQAVVRIVGKGGTERLALLTRASCAAVARYLAKGRRGLIMAGVSEPALWIGVHSGERISPTALRLMVRNRAKRIGLTLTPHGIRRAFATHLLRNGATPLVLRRLLGHISYRHLRHYLRYAPADLIETHSNSLLGS